MSNTPTFIQSIIGALAGSLHEVQVDPLLTGLMSTTQDPSVDVFWQQEYPLADRGRRRWRKKPRDISTVTGLGLHHSGIRGGFGVARYQVAPWLRVWDDHVNRGDAPLSYDPPDERSGSVVPWLPGDVPIYIARGAWAELQALRVRYRGLPYHSISSPADELVVNHLATTYTHHGNGMNRWTWGHAIDDHWKGRPSGYAVAGEQAKLARVYKHLYDRGARLTTMDFHFQYSNKPSDPPKIYLETVALPFAKMHGLKVDMDFRTRKGRSVRSVIESNE